MAVHCAVVPRGDVWLFIVLWLLVEMCGCSLCCGSSWRCVAVHCAVVASGDVWLFIVLWLLVEMCGCSLCSDS